MEPFVRLFFLGITTPIHLVCDVISGIAKGVSWHLAVKVADVCHCESPEDFIPTISCAYKINRPVKVIAESVTGPVHLVVRPDEWIDDVFPRFIQKESLRVATWEDILRGRDTQVENNLMCMSETSLEFFREMSTQPRGMYDNPRVTEEERTLFFGST